MGRIHAVSSSCVPVEESGSMWSDQSPEGLVGGLGVGSPTLIYIVYIQNDEQ